MRRNLDLTALRSFVAVAESGGVTRAAGQLHLTQSAVSMQLKRLEESMGQSLLDRSNRTIGLTQQGELLLSYGRRLLALNDEVWNRMTGEVFEGELVFGVPQDIVYPHIPNILRQFSKDYPRVKVHLHSSFTTGLKEQFAAGKADVVLTTEEGTDVGAEMLTELEIVWHGAHGGTAWKQRPLRLAFERECVFRLMCQRALDVEGIDWEMAVRSSSTTTIDASVCADLAIRASLKGTAPLLEEIDHGGGLPELPKSRINMMVTPGANAAMANRLAGLVRNAYSASPFEGLVGHTFPSPPRSQARPQ